jgi:hypothetical protein
MTIRLCFAQRVHPHKRYKGGNATTRFREPRLCKCVALLVITGILYFTNCNYNSIHTSSEALLWTSLVQKYKTYSIRRATVDVMAQTFIFVCLCTRENQVNQERLLPDLSKYDCPFRADSNSYISRHYQLLQWGLRKGVETLGEWIIHSLSFHFLPAGSWSVVSPWWPNWEMLLLVLPFLNLLKRYNSLTSDLEPNNEQLPRVLVCAHRNTIPYWCLELGNIDLESCPEPAYNW